MKLENSDMLLTLVQSFFGAYLRRTCGASEHSVRAYRYALRMFFLFLAEHVGRSVANLSLNDIQAEAVLAFLHHLESVRGNCVNSRNCRLSAIKSFVEHLLRNDITRAQEYGRILAIPTKRTAPGLITYLEPDDVRSVIEAIDGETASDQRDRALLLFLYNTGARISEALAIRPRDLQLCRPFQVQLLGKGGKQRICPLWSETVNALRSIPVDFDSDERIFLSMRGTPLTRDGRAHMRRYFYKARYSAPREAHRALGYFRQLYLLERELRDAADAERRRQRRDRALPLLEMFRTWLDELAPRVVPKTELATAVGYALNQWEAFVRYCDEGWLMIDNTRSERRLRPIAIGRSNWMFFGSDGGGHTGAILFSLVASSKANRVHPYHYLQDVYERLPIIRERASLLPLLQDACAEVRFPDGTRPNVAALGSPLDCLRVLKDYPRPLIERMRDSSQLEATVVEELTALLPNHWHDAHPEYHLQINRKTRLVGEAA